jgi:hypothetical protein
VIIGGFVLDFVNAGFGKGSGVRVEYLLGVLYFVLGAILLKPVIEPARRAARPEVAAA